MPRRKLFQPKSTGEEALITWRGIYPQGLVGFAVRGCSGCDAGAEESFGKDESRGEATRSARSATAWPTDDGTMEHQDEPSTATLRSDRIRCTRGLVPLTLFTVAYKVHTGMSSDCDINKIDYEPIFELRS